MSDSSEPDRFFRCPVQQENSKVQIRIGGRRIPATLCETSIDGFTLTVAPQRARFLLLGKPWVLIARRERTEVHAEWLFHSPDGVVQIGLRRLRDLTPSHEPRGTVFFGRGLKSQGVSMASSELAFAGLVLVLFLVLTLPGIGDSLGTGPRIRNAVSMLMQSIRLLPVFGT